MSEFVPTESTPEVWPHRFSVAPMMDYTNVHQRHFQRLLTKKAVLYTEMVTANTSKYDNPRFIASFNVDEPVVLQIGGSDIDHMQDAMKMAVDYGYKEININCGCPSDRVAGSGCFGAKLMLDPQLVVRIVQTMSTVSSVPITVKCRIGVDNNDSYDELVEFIHVLSTQANVKHFIVHARKAILNMKLTPNENRTIPPLKYEVVYQLVKDFPQLDFTINGGITTYEDARKHFANGVKGVMVGRSAIDDCYYWRHVDSEFYGCTDPGLTRRQTLEKYGEYGDAQEKQQEERAVRGELLKPLLNLFRCCKGHKIYRRQLEHYGRIEPLFSRALQLAIVGVSDELLDEK